MSVERTVTLGSDPEVAVCLKETGDVIPVCGLFGGEKGAPVPANEHGGWLEDGVALELNPVPHTTPTKAQKSVKALLKAASEFGAKKRTSIHFPIAEHIFPEEVLAKHEKACVFGCAEDLSAYNIGVPRQGVMDEAMREFGPGVRFYGGHIHLGITNWPAELPKFVAVRLLDVLLGAPYFRQYHTYSGGRSRYYGNPGLYRETAYGIEYRTLSNSWLNEDEKKPYTMKRMFDVGTVFANFEKYSERLVQIYNSTDWSLFQQGMESRHWRSVEKALSEACPNLASQLSDTVDIVDMSFPLWSIRNAETTPKKKTVAVTVGDLDLRPGAIHVAHNPLEIPDEYVPWFTVNGWPRMIHHAVDGARNFPDDEEFTAHVNPGARLTACGALRIFHQELREICVNSVLRNARTNNEAMALALQVAKTLRVLVEHNLRAFKNNDNYAGIFHSLRSSLLVRMEDGADMIHIRAQGAVVDNLRAAFMRADGIHEEGEDENG